MTAGGPTPDGRHAPAPVRPHVPAPDRRHDTEPTGLDRGRSSGLDGLRLFAALFVVATHLRSPATAALGPIDALMHGGDTGVWIFFGLSGYLLYKPFLQKPVDLRSYALKRAARIVPGYFVALLAVVALTRPPLFFEHPLPYLTGTFTYNIPLRGFFGNAWTLSAEILFYITLPLIARAARGRETAVLGGLVVGSMLLSLVQLATMTGATEWLYGSYPLVLYAFVPGMLLAVLEVRRPDIFARLASPLYLFAGVLLLAFGALTPTLPIPFGTCFGTPLVMGWLLQHDARFPRALAFGGGASYAVYLLHKDLIRAFGPVGVLLALAGAAASWTFVERPILARAHALASAWRTERAPATAVAPAAK